MHNKNLYPHIFIVLIPIINHIIKQLQSSIFKSVILRLNELLINNLT